MMQEELDPNLESLFQREESRLPEAPFVGATLACIERARFRSALLRKALFVAGLIACALLSPHLVSASAFLSAHLSAAFQVSGAFLDEPAGLAAAFVAGAFFLLLFRRKVFSALSALF